MAQSSKAKRLPAATLERLLPLQNAVASALVLGRFGVHGFTDSQPLSVLPGFLALGSIPDPDHRLTSVALDPRLQRQVLMWAQDKRMGWVRGLVPFDCDDLPSWGGEKLYKSDYAHLVEVVLKLRFTDLIDGANQ